MNNQIFLCISLLVAVSSLAPMDQKPSHDEIIPRYSSIHEAAEHGCLESLTYWIEQGHVNFKNKNNSTALIIATPYNYIEYLKYLIEAHADLNVQNNYGYTALIIAALYKRTESLKLLINANADLNLQNRFGCTALTDAALCNNTKSLKYLIKAKADLNLQDNNGFTALIIAVKYNYTDIIKLLIHAGADLTLKNSYGYTALSGYSTHLESKKIILNELAIIISMNDQEKLEYLCQTNKSFQKQIISLFFVFKIKEKNLISKIPKPLKVFIFLLLWHLQNQNDYRIQLWWRGSLTHHLLQEIKDVINNIDNQKLKNFYLRLY